MTENLAIWQAVERTDPAQTKNFDTGRFKGTAVCLLYNARRATELFGPYGIGWRVEIVKDELIQAGNPESPDTIHTLHVAVLYEHDGKAGRALGIGNTPVSYRTSKGYWTVDHDYAKKSFTDALSKAFSYLGFSADVFGGKYDDNRYVAELKREFAAEPAKPAARTKLAPPPEPEIQGPPWPIFDTYGNDLECETAEHWLETFNMLLDDVKKADVLKVLLTANRATKAAIEAAHREDDGITDQLVQLSDRVSDLQAYFKKGKAA